MTALGDFFLNICYNIGNFFDSPSQTGKVPI